MGNFGLSGTQDGQEYRTGVRVCEIVLRIVPTAGAIERNLCAGGLTMRAAMLLKRHVR